MVKYNFLGLIVLGFLMSSMAAIADKRVALVVGNSAYQHANSLPNPARDAEAMALLLEDLGFEVSVGYDLDQQGLATLLTDFQHSLVDADAALFYYAGHGIQIDNTNYIVSTNAAFENSFMFSSETVSISAILEMMEANSAVNLIFLDACRDNPFLPRVRSMLPRTRSATVASGLAPIVMSGSETLVMYATTSNEVAFDGDGQNSPFTKALLDNLRVENEDISQSLKRVIRDVRGATRGAQSPEIRSTMSIEFVMNEREIASAPVNVRPTRPDPEPSANILPEPANLSRARMEELWEIGIEFVDGGDFHKAEASFREAREIALQVFGPDSAEFANAINLHGGQLARAGKLDEAIEAFETAIAINTALYGPYDPRVANDMSNLAGRLAQAGRLKEAIALSNSAVAIFESKQLTGWQIDAFASALQGSANLKRARGDTYGALVVINRAIFRLELESRNQSNDFGHILATKGDILRELGKCEDAGQIYKAAKAILTGNGVSERHEDQMYLSRMSRNPCP